MMFSFFIYGAWFYLPDPQTTKRRDPLTSASTTFKDLGLSVICLIIPSDDGHQIFIQVFCVLNQMEHQFKGSQYTFMLQHLSFVKRD